MKKLIGSLVLVAGVAAAAVHPAAAGSSTDAALALGAFAVFNQIVRGETIFQPRPVVRETVVVHTPPAVVAPPPPPVVFAPPPPPAYAPPPPAVYAPEPPAVYAPPPVVYRPAPVVVPPPAVVYRPARTVVVYPEGRWVRERGGWVWIPSHPRYAHHARYGYGRLR